MNIEKKVKLQQKIIDDLQQEKDTLREENDKLSVDLELEKILPKEAYERVTQLINELEDRKSEYEALIENVKEIQKFLAYIPVEYLLDRFFLFSRRYRRIVDKILKVRVIPKYFEHPVGILCDLISFSHVFCRSIKRASVGKINC